MADFEKALQRTLAYEGGYKLKFENDLTSYAGIYRIDSPHWEGWRYTNKGKDPPKNEVKDYYYMTVWCPLWCHRIEDNDIAWALFDFAVTTDTETSVKALQNAMDMKETGLMSYTTMEMLECFDEQDIKTNFAINRARHYLTINTSYQGLVTLVNRAIDGITT